MKYNNRKRKDKSQKTKLIKMEKYRKTEKTEEEIQLLKGEWLRCHCYEFILDKEDC